MSKGRVTELLRPLVEELGFEFVGLEYSSNPKNALLRLYIDKPEGIDIEDCSQVSREVAALLDVEDPISGHYNLEVSSPGLDRPLFTPEHFVQFAGEEARVNLFVPADGRRKYRGQIVGVADGQLQMIVDGAEVALDMSNISKANLVPDYDRLLAESDQKPGRED